MPDSLADDLRTLSRLIRRGPRCRCELKEWSRFLRSAARYVRAQEAEARGLRRLVELLERRQRGMKERMLDSMNENRRLRAKSEGRDQ